MGPRHRQGGSALLYRQKGLHRLPGAEGKGAGRSQAAIAKKALGRHLGRGRILPLTAPYATTVWVTSRAMLSGLRDLSNR